jgi:hypothetical protein
VVAEKNVKHLESRQFVQCCRDGQPVRKARLRFKRYDVNRAAEVATDLNRYVPDVRTYIVEDVARSKLGPTNIENVARVPHSAV